MLARTGKEAGFRFGVHPHMLRHACGFKLANDGQDTRALQHYLGHKRTHGALYRAIAGSVQELLGLKGCEGHGWPLLAARALTHARGRDPLRLRF